MKAGQNRKFHKNMQYNQSARQLAVLGASLCVYAAPLALVLFAVALVAYVFTGDTSVHTKAMAALSLPLIGMVGGGRDFLEVMNESDKMPVVSDYRKLITNFDEKLTKFINLIANKEGMPRHKRAYLMHEAETTSDFPILFGTVLERQLIARYQLDVPDVYSYVKKGTQKDFRPADAIGTYGLEGQFDEVAERGEYKAKAIGEGKVSISLKKYGRLFPLSWETLINDDLGALSDVSTRLSNGARRTEWKRATSLIAMSTGPHTSLFGAPIVHPIDGKNVTNKGILPLTHDNLFDTCSLMRRQIDYDGEPIIIDGFELVIPPALEGTMLKILNPASVVVSGGDATAGAKQIVRTSANVVKDLNITGHINPYLPIVDTSAGKDKTWYLFAKLSSGASVKLNFLAGHEAPEICMKSPNKLAIGGGMMSALEGDFENDSVYWRARHVMGGAAIDPRFAYAQVAP